MLQVFKSEIDVYWVSNHDHIMVNTDSGITKIYFGDLLKFIGFNLLTGDLPVLHHNGQSFTGYTNIMDYLNEKVC